MSAYKCDRSYTHDQYTMLIAELKEGSEMEITNEERREVTERLRESREFISGLPKASLEQNAFDTFERILACVDYERGNIFDYLADLIDRPTCRNVGDDYMFKCSECGAEFEPVTVNGNEYGDVFYTPLKPLYCSVCGAEVVEEVRND